MFYPKSQIRENLYAQQGTLVDEKGVSYVGPYHELYTGEMFDGVNQSSSRGKRLIKISEFVNKNKIKQLPKITQFYPKPSQQDYNNGHFTRYFAKQRNGGAGTILEISKETSELIKSTFSLNNLYQTTQIEWKISGPLNDDLSNPHFPQIGIINTNKNIVEGEDKQFSGLIIYIGGNYSKFSK